MAGRAYLMHESEIAAVKAHVAPPNFDGGFFRKREVVTGSECDLFFACQMRKARTGRAGAGRREGERARR